MLLLNDGEKLQLMRHLQVMFDSLKNVIKGKVMSNRIKGLVVKRKLSL